LDADEPASPIARGGAPLAFLVTWVVYVLTLAPSVPGGDGGELVAVAATLGVAHPPGYPLFTLLGKLFTFLPLGSVAWRVNLLAATCGALAAAFLFAAVARWTRAAWAGLLAAGIFAFSPHAWRYAVSAEVFALNDLLVAALLWLAARHAERPRAGGVAAFAAVAGLALSNHHTSVLVVAPLGGWMLWSARAELFAGPGTAVARRLLAIAGAGLAGLLPYLYLPLAAARIPRVSWGATDTLRGFFDHLLRREYGTFSLSQDATAKGDFAGGVARWLASLPGELTVVALLLAALGLLASLRRDAHARGLASALLAALLLYVAVFEGLANLPVGDPLYAGIHARFWLLPDLLVAAFAGAGLAALSRELSGRWRWAAAASWTAAALLVALQLALHWRASDQHEDRIVERYGRSYLAALPPNALLVGRGDLQTNTLRYLQECEGLRPDVRILDRALLAFPWFDRIARARFADVAFPGRVYAPGKPGGYDLAALVAANEGRRPVLMADLAANERDSSLEGRWSSWPLGYASLMLPRGVSPELEPLVAEHERALAGLGFPAPSAWPEDTWERVAVEHYWHARNRLGEHLAALAMDEKGEPRKRLFTLAAESLARLAAEHPSPPYGLYKNLGLAWQELGRREEMREALGRYLRLAPHDDADYEPIRRWVEAR
jgi:hypothetical protein